MLYYVYDPPLLYPLPGDLITWFKLHPTFFISLVKNDLSVHYLIFSVVKSWSTKVQYFYIGITLQNILSQSRVKSFDTNTVT